MRRISSICVIVLACLPLCAVPAAAAEAPFDKSLSRLAEILGSLHFLRNLCGEVGTQWRDEMEKLLEAEKPEADRRAKFVASFNRGYRSFDGAYQNCTTSAQTAIVRYVKEGEALSRDIAARYAN